MTQKSTVTVLGSPGDLDHKSDCTTAELLAFAGANTGNLVFQYAVNRLLDIEKKYVGISGLDYGDPEAFRGSDYFVFPAANHLQAGFELRNVTNFIRTRRVPLILLGLGAQAPSGDEEKSLARIIADPGVREFASAIREKAALVTVRGEFSRRVCEALEIKAITLGCPSLLLSSDVNLGRSIATRLGALEENFGGARVGVTAAAPFEIMSSKALVGLERKFYQWCIEHSGLYVQQSGGDEVVRFSTGDFSGPTLSATMGIKDILMPHASLDQFLQHSRRMNRVYFSAPQWIEELSSLDLVIGTRLHGNMAALAAGVPGIFVPHDSRTQELIETMRLPFVSVENIPDTLEETIGRLEFCPDSFDANRRDVAGKFAEEMHKLGIPVSAHCESLATGGPGPVEQPHNIPTTPVEAIRSTKSMVTDYNTKERENQERFKEGLDIEEVRALERSLMNSTNIAGLYYPEDRSANGFVHWQASQEELVKPLSERVPPTALRHYYGLKDNQYHDDLYLSSGAQDAATIRSILKKDEFSPLGEKIMEFGCSAGRILRNFVEEAKAGEAWGVDLHSAAIHWAQTHLSPPFQFFTNTTTPHLPFEDGYFAFIFAGSVWTHIGELDDAWLLEMRRILRSGGRLYITISDQHTLSEVKRLSPDHTSNAHVEELDSVTQVLSNPFEKFVTRSTPWLQRCVYNRDAWLKRVRAWFEVKVVQESAYGWQTGILLEKR